MATTAGRDRSALDSGWLAGGLGLALIALVLLAFRDTAAAMVGIWIRSETFTHAFLVPPIVAWLVWRRRSELAVAPRRAVPWLLLPIAATCFAWLLADLASVNAATQFAFVTLLVLCVPALFGWSVARLLAFPLLFSYFAVPFGDFMVQPMMDWTADFTVSALQLSGVPVYREGLQFIIPSGHWSVVEACSGVRYLIASFMVGTLFAYLNYRTLQRRLLFVLVSLAVPIVANWVRAYMIVMLAHLTSNQIAAGADHLIYGWVFFGVVIFLMFVIGARWSQAPAPPRQPEPRSATTTSDWPLHLATLVGVLALVLGTQQLQHRLDEPSGRAVVLSAAPAPAAGWRADAPPVTDWQPDYRNPSATVQATFARDGGDTRVGLWLGYYRDQGFDRKLVSSTNGFVPLESLRWTQTARGQLPVPPAGAPAITATLRASADVGQVSAPRLFAVKLWWIGGHWTSSEPRAKLQLALNRLLGRGDDAAVLVVYVPLSADAGTEDAAQTLLGFLDTHWTAIGATLDQTRIGR